MNTEEMLKKEATRLRMAKLRAKRKPPKLANVHHTVKLLPDDNTLSYASVKKWISTQESIVKTARITERSIKSEVSKKIKTRHSEHELALSHTFVPSNDTLQQAIGLVCTMVNLKIN